ncbi:hypothetical protein B0J13DRAFT_54795 [Dactylonectria estremocensis]|uniref:Azaphilone pigments biosynthesis cluster protein L N-terminal domain-containing protein n=1 Tax=Dactylonectria estremocensis TaxID=1079267 RepID=A0A9P9EQ02_9HYPO|nr:hypothetical protein B0J13DRAFT_54795 [Dactylonectria estremocensis]
MQSETMHASEMTTPSGTNVGMDSTVEVSDTTRALLLAAGAAMGVTGLIFQLAERVESLRAFCKSFKDAPHDVSEMGQRLAELRALLNERAKTHPMPSPTLKAVLQRCDRQIRPLEALIAKLEPGFKSRHKSVRVWTRFATTQNAAHVKSLRDELADAKLDLIIANLATSGVTNSDAYPTMQNTLDSLDFTRGHTTSTPFSPSSLPENHLSQINDYLAEINSQVSDLRNSFPDWAEGLQLPVVKKGVNILVQQIFQEALGSDKLKQVMHGMMLSAMEPKEESPLDVMPDEKEQPTVKMNRPTRNYSRSSLAKTCEKEYSSKWTSFFCTVYYRSRIVRSGVDGEDYRQHPQRELESSWIVVPSRWLLRTAYSFQVVKSTRGWNQTIQSFSVVPNDATIFEYAIRGNVDGLRNLLVSRTASPNDCDSQGYTALHRAAALRHTEFCRLLIDNGANVNAVGFVSGQTTLHHLPVNRSRTRADKLYDTLSLLVNSGSDFDIQDTRRQNAYDAFEAFFNWPSRITLRQVMTDCLSLLQGNAWEKDVQQKARTQVVGILYNGIDIDSTVESLDACIKPDSNPEKALSACPRSVASRWNTLHVMNHFRVEPVWHPWSKTTIFQQKGIWSQAAARAMKLGVDPHVLDLEGCTPTLLALRSLFTFHIWQKALLTMGYDLDEFVAKELADCEPLRREGWTHDALCYLLGAPTEDLYLRGDAWREVPEFIFFQDCGGADGLYIRSCWFQLLDILKHKQLLPPGWRTLALPRKFYQRREVMYWNKEPGVLVQERPTGGAAIHVSELPGKDLVLELGQLGVVWHE